MKTSPREPDPDDPEPQLIYLVDPDDSGLCWTADSLMDYLRWYARELHRQNFPRSAKSVDKLGSWLSAGWDLTFPEDAEPG